MTLYEVPPIVAALRVRNEARWIGEVLESVGWCDQVYLFDDHSTDDTVRIAERHGATVIHSDFDGLDEARDKESLAARIAAEMPRSTWVLMVDGDEVLRRGGKEKIEAAICRYADAWDVLALSLRITYLWNDRHHYRADGVYGNFRRPSLFRLDQPLAFRTTPFGRQGAHLHCSSAPAAALTRCRPCRAELLHLGYMAREDRIRKWDYYNTIDPCNAVEGYDQRYPWRRAYPHIVQGDVPEVPAGVRLRHAGPLDIRELEHD